MQPSNFSGGQELLCINTEKVYDWIVNEANFDLNLNDLDLPVNPHNGEYLDSDDIDIDSVSCKVVPHPSDPFDILNREDQQFIIDGTEVTLQIVTIRKKFLVKVFANLVPGLGGTKVKIGSSEFNRTEQVILCAPEDTKIEISYTDLECFVSSATIDPAGTTDKVDSLDVSVTVRLCQSIQSTFDVTLEITADFCQPRDILPISSAACPSPMIPPQCPVIFPNNGFRNDNNG